MVSICLEKESVKRMSNEEMSEGERNRLLHRVVTSNRKNRNKTKNFCLVCGRRTSEKLIRHLKSGEIIVSIFLCSRKCRDVYLEKYKVLPENVVIGMNN